MTIRGKGKVTVKDNGWDALMKSLSKMSGGRFVRVGILGTEKPREGDPYTNIQIGSVHEFGSTDGKIPERSFLRSTLDDNRNKYYDLISSSFKKVLKHQKKGRLIDWDKFFGKMGEVIVVDVKKKIRTGIKPDLAPATRRARTKGPGGASGKMTPLIDTGQLLGSIRYKVSKKS